LVVLALVLVRRGPGKIDDEDDSDPSEECMLTDDDPLAENDEQLEDVTRLTLSEFFRLADVES
jgi:hypothetical protein